MSEIDIHIPGQPFAQKRHRTSKGRRYDPSSSDKKVIQKNLLFYKQPRLLEGPVSVRIWAFFQMPKSWSKKKRERMEGSYRPKKPDNDNIEKIYWDAMSGMIYTDDNQIAHNETFHRYSSKPRVRILVKKLEHQTNGDRK